jgi:hypothetical protein
VGAEPAARREERRDLKENILRKEEEENECEGRDEKGRRV